MFFPGPQDIVVQPSCSIFCMTFFKLCGSDYNLIILHMSFWLWEDKGMLLVKIFTSTNLLLHSSFI